MLYLLKCKLYLTSFESKQETGEYKHDKLGKVFPKSFPIYCQMLLKYVGTQSY